MFKIIFSVFLLLAGSFAMACKTPAMWGASLPMVVQKSQNLLYVEVGDQVELRDSKKEGVQISEFKTLKIFKGTQVKFTRFVSETYKGQGNEVGYYHNWFGCDLAYSYVVGANYLVAADLRLANSIIPINQEIEASQIVQKMEKAEVRYFGTIFSDLLNLGEADVISSLETAIKFCSQDSMRCSGQKIRELLGGGKIYVLVGSNSEKLVEHLYKFILLPRVAQELEKRESFDLLSLFVVTMVAQKRNFKKFVIKDKGDEKLRLRFAIWTEKLGLSIVKNGKDVTRTYFYW
ncbi:hypothetical protein D3C87_175440 [compost metagenome]